MMSSADICRANGWAVGDTVEGREEWAGYWSESRVVITAIGEEGVLAREVARRNFAIPAWNRVEARESKWSLDGRDWKRVEAASPGGEGG